MRNFLYSALVLTLAVSIRADAAKGIILGTGTAGGGGKLLAFVNDTTP